MAPFQSAVLQSNAIMTVPKTPADLRPQYAALCTALDLDPAAPDTLAALRDPARVPASRITRSIETDAVGTEHGTYRGALFAPWLPVPSAADSSTDPMTWQRTGALAHALRAKGVKSILIGDVPDEWYLYSIAHPIKLAADVPVNLRRYYPGELVDKMLTLWDELPEDATAEEAARRFGEILCAGQVHVPVRVLHRDLVNAGFPVVRYAVRWAPEGVRPFGKLVTHGSDRCLWAFREPRLGEEGKEVARRWLDSVDQALQEIEAAGKPLRGVKEVLTLKEDRSIHWSEDPRWEQDMKMAALLPGEEVSSASSKSSCVVN